MTSEKLKQVTRSVMRDSAYEKFRWIGVLFSLQLPLGDEAVLKEWLLDIYNRFIILTSNSYKTKLENKIIHKEDMNLKNICVLYIFIFRKKPKLYKGGRQAESKLLETLSL